MQLAYRGVIAPTQEAMLEVADIARDGVSNDVGETGGYITFQQLTTTANYYGQQTQYVYSWGQLDQLVNFQEPVTVLLDNTVLQPRQYPNDPGWNAHHFILLTSTQIDQNRYSSDPLSYYIGSPYFYTEYSTRQASANLGNLQAQALVPLDTTPEPPPVETLMLMEDWQLRAWVLSDLYQWAGIPYNAEDPTSQGWVDALREGKYLGRPRTTGRNYGEGEDAGVWVEFDHGLLVARARDGATSWKG